MKPTILAGACALLLLSLCSCLKSEVDEYDAWRKLNDDYIASIDTREYECIVPDWAPGNSVYIKWHNDRSLTADSLVAISTSTVDMKYELEDIDGTKLGNSYNALSGDSIYRSCPNQNIVGMWIAMTTMHVGDSATLIIPYSSAYGSQQSVTIRRPYTNLIYRVKIKGIPAYEKPYNP